MGSSVPSPATVQAVFDQLGPPGTPFTTPEIAAEFDCSDRTIYNRLDALVDEGVIETKKVGARGRVWWRPVDGDIRRNGGAFNERNPVSFRDEQALSFLSDSEMAERIRKFEWAKTPLGPMDGWPLELRVAADIMLGADEAIGLYWGEDLTLLYNDAWRELIGDKHPEALGRPAQEVFPEIWETIEPMFADVLDGNGVGFEREQRLSLERDGQIEDAWFDYSANPILMADGSVGGVFNIANEITERKDAQQTLRDREGRLNAFVTSTSEIVYRMSPDWSEMYYLDGKDFIADTEDPRETWLKEYIPPDEQERVMAAIEEAIETKSMFELEHQVHQVDGTRGWTHSRAVPILDDDGDIVEWFGTASDVTERRRAEQALRESEQRYQRLFDSVNESIEEAFFIIERVSGEGETAANGDDPAAYRFVETNPVFEKSIGVTDVVGKQVSDLDFDGDLPGSDVWGEVVRTGESRRFEIETTGGPLADGWYDVRVFPYGGADSRAAACLADDITDQKEVQRSLERLTEASRELIEADPEMVHDRVAELTIAVLDVEYAALWRYDEASGDLIDAISTLDTGIDAETVRHPDDASEHVWQAFIDDETAVTNNLHVDETVPDAATLRSRLLIPLGRHGVVCIGSFQPNGFDERIVDLAETLGATLETAWDRADSERQLQVQNEELQRLDRLNTLIREIDQALVGADTREEIDEAVCERLASSDLYEFAWLGEYDPGTNRIEPRAWAGVDSGYVEELTITVEDTPTNRDPIARALRTGDLQVVADIATDSGFAPWREATLERGARSLVCIPLVYDDAAYGVLTVYADRPQSDEDKRNRDVLSELGDTTAHALNARETRATLQTDSVVELTLRFEDADTPLYRLSRETEYTIEHQGFVPRSSGQTDVFFIVREISPEDLRATAERSLAFEDLDCLTERADGALFRARVSEPTLAARVTDEGAVVRSITIDSGVATVVLDIPHTAAVREFLNRLRQWHPELELRARQSRERPLKTRQTFVTALEDRLTDRQREVLQTAYLSGFFEMPRVSNGQEVTHLVGVSQPTFSEHLRAAERTLCEVLFETEPYAEDIVST
ncbi:putative PAS/PAC sensor protein (plasmid) [Haloterrigena turkmenica DSM 5511]|uniref:PAS/PAC sensor protein n=1 Tax=Haloterrigena turkmenica (strain ATCC 51198 / DSM 5511 / JCM 9101 / NCIMB 13204 / VKM B-1734 / 4k) TaxID=543526 RepID=D2S0L8_HALTV|nr:bacterio-opsin activator domain-containing protein [Haloterrigena turkmenica]ADB62915.1 putative PAS/PAC sensor protein [Haloterrigena turkmenica DSM 5511]